MDILNRTEALAEDFKRYIATRIELMKLETLDKSSEIGAGVVSRVIVSMVAMFALLFVSIGLALYLSILLDIQYVGFLIVGAFYGLVFLILLIGRSSMLEKPIRNNIVAGAMAKEETESAEPAIQPEKQKDEENVPE